MAAVLLPGQLGVQTLQASYKKTFFTWQVGNCVGLPVNSLAFKQV